MVTVEKGSRMKFAEIEQEDVIFRFLLPDLENIQARLAYLAQKYPNISLVRIGNAIVSSKDDTNEYMSSLLDIPSKVEGSYQVDLCGDHPVLNHGPARFSKELIEVIIEADISNVSLAEEHVEKGQMSVYDMTALPADNPSVVQAPKPDLAASLRAQLHQQHQIEQVSTPAISPAKEKINTLQEQLKAQLESKKNASTGSLVALPKQVSVEKKEEKVEEKELKTPTYVPENEVQKKLNEAIEKKASNSRAEIKVSESRPQNKLDILLERVDRIEKMLTHEPNVQSGEVLPSSKMTSKELQAWFWETHDTVGSKETFDLLASMLK